MSTVSQNSEVGCFCSLITHMQTLKNSVNYRTTYINKICCALPVVQAGQGVLEVLVHPEAPKKEQKN